MAAFESLLSAIIGRPPANPIDAFVKGKALQEAETRSRIAQETQNFNFMMKQIEETRMREQMLLDREKQERGFGIDERRLGIAEAGSAASIANMQEDNSLRRWEVQNRINNQNAGYSYGAGGVTRPDVPITPLPPQVNIPGVTPSVPYGAGAAAPALPLSGDVPPPPDVNDPNNLLLPTPETPLNTQGGLLPEANTTYAQDMGAPPSLTPPVLESEPAVGQGAVTPDTGNLPVVAGAPAPVASPDAPSLSGLPPELALPEPPSMSDDFGQSEVAALRDGILDAEPRIDARLKALKDKTEPADRIIASGKRLNAGYEQYLADKKMIEALERAKSQAVQQKKNLPRLASIAQINELASQGFESEVKKFKGRLTPNGTLTPKDQTEMDRIATLIKEREALQLPQGSPDPVISRKRVDAEKEMLKAQEDFALAKAAKDARQEQWDEVKAAAGANPLSGAPPRPPEGYVTAAADLAKAEIRLRQVSDKLKKAREADMTDEQRTERAITTAKTTAASALNAISSVGRWMTQPRGQAAPAAALTRAQIGAQAAQQIPKLGTEASPLPQTGESWTFMKDDWATKNVDLTRQLAAAAQKFETVGEAVAAGAISREALKAAGIEASTYSRLMGADSARLLPAMGRSGNRDAAPYVIEGRYFGTNRVTAPMLAEYIFEDFRSARSRPDVRSRAAARTGSQVLDIVQE